LNAGAAFDLRESRQSASDASGGIVAALVGPDRSILGWDL
jgi:hypothetical protein